MAIGVYLQRVIEPRRACSLDDDGSHEGNMTVNGWMLKSLERHCSALYEAYLFFHRNLGQSREMQTGPNHILSPLLLWSFVSSSAPLSLYHLFVV